MDPKDYLLQIVAQTVDALSFTQTHVIDEDFRAHNRATMDSVRSLQREQHNRVEQVYGPQSPSSDSLAQQLLSCYRGEITMLELGRGKEDRDSVELVSDLAISMSHDQCLALKREMKQRIHEWERVFREERGVAVATRDKAVLRHVYELYRLVKNRLRSEESPPNGEDVGNPNTAIGQQAPHQGQGLMHPSGGYGDRAGLPGGRVMTAGGLPPAV
uniref:FAM13A-like domain-containing protein n=1 Tax=Trypanosoma congolense (strain IL3000) TaxID=1068625 RepID=G0UW13_TRYCI|nr:conserved hypothetical protein [Trypanosoma congolense IL3000]